MHRKHLVARRGTPQRQRAPPIAGAALHTRRRVKMNVARVTRALLRENRWMLILLVLWPVVMAGIVLFPSGSPDKDDALSVLHQECFYALALVAVTGASTLGNEQRSRRSVFVLARAVSRAQY